MQTIDAVAIIQRLEHFVLGNADTMTSDQVAAALGLLDRVLPSLVEVEVKCPESARVATSLVKG